MFGSDNISSGNIESSEGSITLIGSNNTINHINQESTYIFQGVSVEDQSIVPNSIPANKLSTEQEKICTQLEKVFEISEIHIVSPRKLFISAIFAINSHEQNPDWMAQSAHSFREIFKILNSNGNTYLDSLKKVSGTIPIEQKNLPLFYRFFTSIAHHNIRNKPSETAEYCYQNIFQNKKIPFNISRDEYKKVVKTFEYTLSIWLDSQINLHFKLDAIITKGYEESRIEELNSLLSINRDARNYFFEKVPVSWLEFLDYHKFFDVFISEIKEQDGKIYTSIPPELFYLRRASKENPVKVADILLKYDTSINFDTEVHSQFLLIIEKLPSENIPKLIQKIYEEQWIEKTLKNKFFSQILDFVYIDIFKKIIVAKDYNSLILLTDVILTIEKSSKERNSKKNRDGYFLFSDHQISDFFSYFIRINNNSLIIDKKNFPQEELLQKFLQKYSEIIKLQERYFPKDNSPFEYKDNMMLGFSSPSVTYLNNGGSNDPTLLMAAIKEIFPISLDQKDVNISKKIIEHFENLPSHKITDQLYLYLLSQYPKECKILIEERIEFWISGKYNLLDLWAYAPTEIYLVSLKGFKDIDINLQRKFIDYILSVSTEKDTEESKSQIYRKGSLLYPIKNFLTPEEIVKIESDLGELAPLDEKFDQDSRYKGIQETNSRGMQPVREVSPIALEDFSKKTIEEFFEYLSSKEIQNLPEEDFWDNKPSKQGLRNVMSEDFILRPLEYINNGEKFLEEPIKEFFLSYFLTQTKDFLEKEKTEEKIYKNILDISIQAIALSRENDYEISRLIRQILQNFEKHKELDFQAHREDLLKILILLCNSENPDIKRDRSSLTENHKGCSGSDPLHIAINSDRGIAFEALVFFMYLDALQFDKEEKSKIQDDTKEIFENFLNPGIEKTIALRLLFAKNFHHLYARDKQWGKLLIPNIFPIADTSQIDLCLASFEGYFCQNITGEIFDELRSEHLWLINLPEKQYTKRKYFRELNKGLAVHLALAFIYGYIELDDELIQEFFEKKSAEGKKDFIHFIDSHCFSEKFPFEERSINKEKFELFWEWRLENSSDVEELQAFTRWIDREGYTIFEKEKFISLINQTFKKLNGNFSYWDIDALMRNLTDFATASPKDTADILEYIFVLKKDIGTRHVYQPEEYLMPTMEILLGTKDIAIIDQVKNIANHLSAKGVWAMDELSCYKNS